MKLAASLSVAAAAAVSGLVVAAGPAQAQGRGVMEVIVYGNDPCPRSSDAEVVVCVRRPDSERYRIPEAYSAPRDRQAGEAWANRARALEYVSDTGTFSCSAVGPGGYTGCLQQFIRQSTGERREQIEGDNPPM